MRFVRLRRHFEGPGAQGRRPARSAGIGAAVPLQLVRVAGHHKSLVCEVNGVSWLDPGVLVRFLGLSSDLNDVNDCRVDLLLGHRTDGGGNGQEFIVPSQYLPVRNCCKSVGCHWMSHSFGRYLFP